MSQLVDFMKDKWRFWMSVCDLQNGEMRSADWNQGADQLIQEYNLSGAKANEIQESFKHMGAVLLGEGHLKGNVSVESERVAVNLTRFLLTNRADALEFIDSVIRLMFSAVDSDGDDYLDEKEFYSVCKALLIKEKFWGSVYRRVASPESGRVNSTTGTMWWVDFIMGVDRGSWDETQSIFSV